MVKALVNDKVYYKIFDRSNQGSTLIYSKYKFTDAAKLAEVAENQHLIINEMQASSILILQQIHGTIVAEVGDETDPEHEPEADASITSMSGLILGIQTADCVPVLFSCSDGETIAAAHCGWRSAKANIIQEVANKMRATGVKSIKAVIGPSIQQFSYEVNEQYYLEFIKDSKNNAAFFIPSIKNEHYMFDLPAYVKQKLVSENIEIIEHINEDTYSMDYKYPSYRRSSHKGEKYSQNILSVIVKK